MTKSSQSNQLTTPSSQPTSPESSQMVDAYAENLMDDLFEGVDRILDHDPTDQLPAEAPAAAPVDAAMAGTTISGLYPDAVSPSIYPEERPAFQADTVTVPAMIVPTGSAKAVETNADAEAKDPDAQSETTRGKGNLLIKAAVGVACLTGLIAVGVWAARTQPQTASSADLGQTNAQEGPTISEEVAFGEYLQRSLNLIDGQQQAQGDSTSVATGTVIPAPASNSNVTQGGNNRPNIIERVFVPVFQPSQTGLNRPTLPAPNQSARRPATQNSNQAAAPAPAAPSGNLPAPNTTAIVPNISPVNTHMLVGVLELGDRSAALFEVNGVPQRVYVGERVGSTAWSVVSVANQEVVVRRNGEVRSIYIGQEF